MRDALKITGAELRLVRLELLNPFTIATGTMYERVFPLVTLRGDGIEGYAEGVMDTVPTYLDESLAGSMNLLSETLLPSVVGRSFANPEQLHAELTRFRGFRMSLAALEMAFYDLWAKSLDLPLMHVLGGHAEAVDVGVSLGIGPIDDTLRRVEDHVAQGYRRIKLKIRPGHDLAMLHAVRGEFPDTKITADANASFTLADTALLQRIDDIGLDYLEQPLAWDDLHDHAVLQQRIRTPLCLDESIRTAADARKALQSDACRVLNIKVARSGGYVDSLLIHDLCSAFAVPNWCGGMLESGIGRAHNIHLSALPNFSKPGDVSSASRYFRRDIIEQELESTDGRMPVPNTGAGIGVTLDRGFLDSVTIEKREFSA